MAGAWCSRCFFDERRVESEEYENRPSLRHKCLSIKVVTVLTFWSNLCYKTEQLLEVRIVNGINKDVTRTSETIKDEEHTTEARSDAVFRFCPST